MERLLIKTDLIVCFSLLTSFFFQVYFKETKAGMNGCMTLIFRWGMREKKMLIIAVLGQLQKFCTSLRNVNIEVYNSFFKKNK